jgi:hypothetical protein
MAVDPIALRIIASRCMTGFHATLIFEFNILSRRELISSISFTWRVVILKEGLIFIICY